MTGENEIGELMSKLRMFAEIGRDRRSNVVLNGYHAQVLAEAADKLESLSERICEQNELISRMIAQYRVDLGSAHSEICKLNKLDPATHTWPDWTPQANTLRWFDQIEAALTPAGEGLMPEPLMQDDVVELLPCPFCGGKATCSPADDSGEVVYAVACLSCLAQITKCDEMGAIRQWNTRALAAHDLAVGERIERLTKALSEIRDLSSDNYDSDRAWALAMQLRARCELHGWLEQRGVK
jgi:Lar family restriction alleviation protein